MVNTNITNLRKDLFGMLEKTIKYNEPINVTTKDGNAIILSEDEYKGMMETLYLTSVPGLSEAITEARNTPIDEYLSEDEVEW